MVSSNPMDRVVRLSQGIKELKTSQMIGGDNNIPYTVIGGESGVVKDNLGVLGTTGVWFDSGSILYNDPTGLNFQNMPSVVFLETDFPFVSASVVGVRVWANNTEITNWSDYRLGGNLTSMVMIGGGLTLGIMSYAARRESSLVSGNRLVIGTGWIVEIGLDGSSWGVGTSIRYELTLRSSKDGRLVPYE